MCGCWPAPSGGAASPSPTWTKYTVGFASLKAAAFVNNFTFLNLPAAAVISGIKAKVGTAFTGVTSPVLRIFGDEAIDQELLAFFDGGTVANTSIFVSAVLYSPNQAATVPIRIGISVDTGGADLNSLAAGSVDIWLLQSVAN